MDYLPAWPAVVLPVEESRLSYLMLASGCLWTLVFALFLAGVPHAREQHLLLRLARWPGGVMIGWLEQLWRHFQIDET